MGIIIEFLLAGLMWFVFVYIPILLWCTGWIGN